MVDESPATTSDFCEEEDGYCPSLSEFAHKEDDVIRDEVTISLIAAEPDEVHVKKEKGTDYLEEELPSMEFVNELQSDMSGEVTTQLVGTEPVSASVKTEKRPLPFETDAAPTEFVREIEYDVMRDEVTPQFVADGALGLYAKKKKKPHALETNLASRKRQQIRLLRKLRHMVNEFATRVGQQVVVLIATPGSVNTSYKVFGAKPLEDVVKNLRDVVLEELECALAHQDLPIPQRDPSLYELPPFVIDGIPTPLDKMTQAQLRAFIPQMLKYSTGRGKPGWGRKCSKPPWWPDLLPWSNIRSDIRSDDEKVKVPWTYALRQVVISCYKFHGRADLLPGYCKEDEKENAAAIANSILHSDEALKENVEASANTNVDTQYIQTVLYTNEGNEEVAPDADMSAQYETAVLHGIASPDGVVGFIQIDPNNPIITLPDGTTAYIQGITMESAEGDGQGEVIDLSYVTEEALNSEEQFVMTSEDGCDIFTVPAGSMYQTMATDMENLQDDDEDGDICITPVTQEIKEESNN